MFFVDYEKAFDFLDRRLLWQKPLTYIINGKILRVLKSMYSKTRACVRVNRNVLIFFIAMWVSDKEIFYYFTMFINDFEPV